MLFEVLFDGKVRASTSYLECIPTKNTLLDMEHTFPSCSRLQRRLYTTSALGYGIFSVFGSSTSVCGHSYRPINSQYHFLYLEPLSSFGYNTFPQISGMVNASAKADIYAPALRARRTSSTIVGISIDWLRFEES